ncbi:tetratricopeptide repeat protein [Paracoccus sp. Z330]|uniref:Tetratricopeptide repeat protein n=1 Tax=Paracoccus onchidii TaxID=3017813 RepID=A0ABT4ZBJ4_9RHOB|nr:tetratricopeptide repeat protein [Paracoccus onchidii]MDB6176740.1 tetratricopeptide repeat protein [Paracoccus onchidii]
MTRPNLALTVALFLSVGLPAGVFAQDRPSPRPGEEVQDSAPTFGLAGPYLAARMAAVESDFRAAARYFAQAVAHDPGDAYLEDSALVAFCSAGGIERAVKFAAEMEERGDGTELSRLVHSADLVHQGKWDDLLERTDPENASPRQARDRDLMVSMIRAWALMGAGRASEALALLEEMSGNPEVAPMVNYHLALARALVGDYESAATLLSDRATGSHVLGYMARAEVLAQLERRDEAIGLLNELQGLDAEPQLMELRDRLQAGEQVGFDVVRTPADGIAQVFLTFATALASSSNPEPLSLIHARLASWLSPDMAEARLMVAQLLQEHQQFELAEQEYETLRRKGQMRPVAELTRIEALAQAEHHAEAEKAALSLTAAYPELPQAWIALGDLLRQQQKFAQAVPAYDKALTMLQDAPAQARWFPLYARGIALERSGQFARAEKDLLAAIEIRPDQASLLNYLGYSWIDRGENLDRALDMIRQAVRLSPDDGYILDSLAWAYYRLGRYSEAVVPMEQAIGTMAADPLVNDHLGDIYWKVGRKREAEIQWKRALSLDPDSNDDVDADRIRAKLERGLDAVLADEGDTDSLSPAQANAPTTQQALD